MRDTQIERVEEQLIRFINRVVDKETATPAELEALPKVALALAKIASL